MAVYVDLPPATVVYDSYWRFAAERQEILHRRMNGWGPPWTEDPILARYKFTNAYRASDRVSQYLIRNVIYEGDQSPEEVFFRTILFKLFNKIETWELLLGKLGQVRYADAAHRWYDSVLGAAMEAKQRIYSAAYIMPSGSTSYGHALKYRNHLALLQQMMRDGVPRRVANATSMREVFDLLRSYPTVGGFLAYQFTVDLNYSELTDFSEMDFVEPGPGALDGISKCFPSLGGLSPAEIIYRVSLRQEMEFEERGIDFRPLGSKRTLLRRLHLIDCQNLFCEISKYARLKHPEVKGVSGRTQIKQVYHPNHEPIDYWYPPKWGINPVE